MAQVRQFAASLNGRTLVVPQNRELRIQRASGTASSWSFVDNTAFSMTDNTTDGTVTIFELDLNGSGATIAGAIAINLVGIATTANRVKKIADVISRSSARYSAKGVGGTLTAQSYDQGLHPGSIFRNVSGTPIGAIGAVDSDLTIESINFGLPFIPEANLPTSFATTAPGPLTGTVWYYFSYFDAKHNVESPIFCPFKVTGLAGNGVLISLTTLVNAAPPRTTHIKVYRSQSFPDGTNDDLVNTFHLIAFIGAGGPIEGPAPTANQFWDQTSDAELSAITLSATRGTIPADFQFVHTHDNRVWGVTGDVIKASSALNPDEFDINAVWAVGDEPGFDITALASQNDTLLAFKKSSMYALFYDTNPIEEMAIQRVLSNRGCINPKTVIDVDGQTFVLDYNGVYVFEDLSRTTPLSGKIQDFVSRMNLSVQEKFSAVRTKDKVIFFVALDDDTEPFHAFVLDLDAFRGQGREIRWWITRYDTGVLDSTMFFMAESDQKSLRHSLVPLIFDSRAQTWILEWLESDGVPSPLISDAEIETTANVAGFGEIGISTSADGRGFSSAAYSYTARWLPIRLLLPSGLLSDALYIRTVNSNTTIQVHRALTAEELAATRLYVGPIVSEYDSATISLGDLADRKEARMAYLVTTPMPFAGAVELRFERDRSGPDFMTETVDDGKYQVTQDREGFIVPVGGSLREGGRGMQDVPLSGKFHTIAYRVSNFLPNRPFRINSLEIEKYDNPAKRLQSN